MIKRLGIWILALVFAAVAAQAATLQLKDGRIYDGTYLGGTKDQVQFLINGQVQVFNTSDVASIDFLAPAPEAAAPQSMPPEQAPQQQAPPEQPPTDQNAGLTQSVTVPQGTPIMISMIDSVDSKVNHPGDIFHASLVDDLKIGDVVVARRDADVFGKLVQVKSAGKMAGQSELRLELISIRTVNGTLQPVVTGEYEAVGKSQTKQTVKHSVIGAVAGGIIGAIAGGGEGAAAGAGIGAAAGAGVSLITHGQQIKIPSETILKFQLAQPFMITVAKQS